MGLATLEPGYESHYEGRPAIYPVLTVGAIAAERRHPDGRWDIALRGLSRVELVDELPPNEPFRLAKVRRLRELERNDDRVGAENLRSAVVQVANHLPALWPQLSPQLASAKTPGLLADIVAATFVESSSLRRELLDELVISKRLDRLQDYLAKVLLDLAMRSRSESATSRESLN
jgi:Lon protease-like protein